jgi:Tfp pilus assembly PilM family ATPase
LDIGTHALKLVQVERTKDGWRVLTPLLVPYPQESPASCGEISRGFTLTVLESLLSPGTWNPIAPAGCVLSMELCSLQSLEIPPGTEAEQRQMVESELSESEDWNSEEQVFDIWPDATPSRTASDSLLHVLSVPRSAASGLAHDLLPFGLQCESIDGLPFALARAASLFSGDSDEVTAALDWGASAATLVLCQHGRPVFIRRLRDSGYTRILEQIHRQLELPMPESACLLEAIGMHSPDMCPINRVSRIVSAAAAASVHGITEEIGRTLRFLKADSGIEPAALILMGGGACIRHVDPRFAELTGLATRCWTFPESQASDVNTRQGEAVFATAYAAAIGGAS